MQTRRLIAAAALALSALATTALPAQIAGPARPARISEQIRTIPTYPFSEPNPAPILARDTRLYPYFSFDGYAHESTPTPWKVVTLENDLIEVFILPEIGGKVWGARVKKTGRDFIYRNEVIKFRNVALRGPWTSGGIEFNFGVVGHTPSTATPVDYALRENADGSVSCIVGTMDLPSRTEWRVEIRLPADRAAFETNVLWHNPTPLEQPYYNWMTAAAVAKDDLEMTIPGSVYLDHPGPRHDWPTDAEGRYLPIYGNNRFGSNKSFHVVGEFQDTFGGYYAGAGNGFGHWSRHEEMPGQKLWLWALSRAGGIWEPLLTDTNGQYVEYQAGRLLVQYTPGADVTPIRQVGFDPSATDRWSETWFPVEGIGGLTDASRDGALFAKAVGNQLQIGVHAFAATTDTLRVWSGGVLALERLLTLTPLEPVTLRVPHTAGAPFRVTLTQLGIDYSSDPATRRLARPFESDPAAAASIPAVDTMVFQARELIQSRRYEQARPLLEKALAANAWHHDGLLALADLEYRRARFGEGLVHANRALRLDAYDAAANFIAGNLYRALGRLNDAREAFGWAARAMAFRSAANVQLAELALGRHDWTEADRYARIALDYNRLNLSAWEVIAVAARHGQDAAVATAAAAELLALDPLHHFVRAERYLATPSPQTLSALTEGLRSEFPDQSILELAIGYANRGQAGDAVALLDATAARYPNPLLRAWRAYLKNDPSFLATTTDTAFVFPYRIETLPVLTWAAGKNAHWSWTYLRALNLWGFDRIDEAARLLTPLGDTPTTAAFYVTRAALTARTAGSPEHDLQRATTLAGADRTMRIPLIQFYQANARWTDALTASQEARRQFPRDFNLDLLTTKSLIHLNRGADALSVLGATKVLPSEHARESHQMYVQAHVLEALAAITARRLDDARQHLTLALEWPEHLGQGKPYEPDERLVRFLLGRVEQRAGRTADARRQFESVVAATTPVRGLGALDTLAIPALAEIGAPVTKTRALLAKAAGPGADPGSAALARALAAGTPIRDLATRYPRTFSDLDATLVLRALRLQR